MPEPKGNTMLKAGELTMAKRKQCGSTIWGGRVILLCALMLSSTLARAGSPKMSKDLAGAGAADKVDVIVRYTGILDVRAQSVLWGG